MMLSDKELEDASAFIEESIDKAWKFRQLCSDDTRGMLMFLHTLYVLSQHYAGLWEKVPRAPLLLAEWYAAGKPEDPKDVVPNVAARAKKESVQ
jgi:hypothetical protein